jgi:hypothetical protein
VSKARSLYITAKSAPQGNKKKSSLVDAFAQAQPDLPSSSGEDFEAEETIIACINFAKIDDRGMFVNWLATSNEAISRRKYGESLSLVCIEGLTWQRRGLAAFLLKAAHLSVVMHLRVIKQLRADHCILLQARTAAPEQSAHFYTALGFDEGDIISSSTQLAKSSFEEFPSMLEQAAKSHTDYMHFIWESEDICLFKNATGTFGQIKRRWIPRDSNSNYESAMKLNEKSLFSFPFAFIRQHLLLLASQLDLFFLPFQDAIDLSDFILPNKSYPLRSQTSLTERDVEQIAKKSGWLTDPGIDFYTRW